MSFDPTWEAIHHARVEAGVPWSPLALMDFPPFLSRVGEMFHREQRPGPFRALDIGCGGGSCTIVMATMGYEVTAIDGSASAVDVTAANVKAAGLSADVVQMDAMEIGQAFPADYFDLIIDMVCLQHCRPAQQKGIVEQIRTVLKPGGWVYSRMAAAGSYGQLSGERIDERTYTNLTMGPGAGYGTLRFATRQDIVDLWGWLYTYGHFVLDCRTNSERSYWWMEWVVEGRKR